VLDPRISYDGMRHDYSDDPDLLQYLENTMMDLRAHYDDHYARDRDTLAATQHSSNEPTRKGSSVPDSSPSKLNFTSRYKREERLDRDELAEYFKLQREDWDAVNPLQWWVERRAQFPCLYKLARDLLTIPGKCLSLLFLVCNILNAPQVLRWPWSVYFLEGVIRFRCDVQVCNRKPFVF
jgi:hypothetical protein